MTPSKIYAVGAVTNSAYRPVLSSDVIFVQYVVGNGILLHLRENLKS